MKALLLGAILLCAAVMVYGQGSGAGSGQELQGKRLFEQDLFAGSGRTCQTCHSQKTGTVSPEDAQKRFTISAGDPLFRHDGKRRRSRQRRVADVS